MAHLIIKPAGDIVKQWTPSAGTTHYTLLDEGMLSKNITDYIVDSVATHEDRFQPNVSISDSLTDNITDITLYLYVLSDDITSNPGLTIKFYQDGVEVVSESFCVNTGGAWHTCTFEFTGLDLDPADGELQIGLIVIEDTIPPSLPSPVQS